MFYFLFSILNLCALSSMLYHLPSNPASHGVTISQVSPLQLDFNNYFTVKGRRHLAMYDLSLIADLGVAPGKPRPSATADFAALHIFFFCYQKYGLYLLPKFGRSAYKWSLVSQKPSSAYFRIIRYPHYQSIRGNSDCSEFLRDPENQI